MKFKRDNPQEKVWADWLSDSTPTPSTGGSPEPHLAVTHTNRRPTLDGIRAQLRSGTQPRVGTKIPAVAQSGGSARANITLHIQLPDVGSMKRAIVKLPWRRIRLAILTIAAVTVVLTGGMFLLSARKNAAVEAAAKAQSSAPGFTPLVSQSATKDGTSAGTNYEPAKKLYVYHDVYQGVEVTVSQQPMPASIKSPESKLADIAHSIGATEKLQTSLGSVYYTQPDEDGSQRVVFTNKQALVFASSKGTMTARDWVNYVQNLN